MVATKKKTSRPSAKPKKMTRDELRHDEFIDHVVDYWEWARKNATMVGGVVGALLLLVVGSTWWVNAREDAKIEASNMLATAQLNAATATPLYDEIVSEYDGTPAAGKAAFMLAKKYLEDGDVVQAKTYFKKYIDGYDTDNFLGQGAMAGLADCLVREGNNAEAAGYYEKAAKINMGHPQAEAYLYSAAAAYQAAGNSEKARAIAQSMIDSKDTDQTFRGRAEILLKDLGE